MVDFSFPKLRDSSETGATAAAEDFNLVSITDTLFTCVRLLRFNCLSEHGRGWTKQLPCGAIASSKTRPYCNGFIMCRGDSLPVRGRGEYVSREGGKGRGRERREKEEER